MADSVYDAKEYIEKLKDAISGKDFTYSVITYGCQMNAHDSERIEGILRAAGATPAESAKDADVVIFNTCCVRDHAEQRVFGNIGHLRKVKEERPELIIAVCGCMMQQDDAAEKLLRRFPYVDFVFGTGNLHKLPKLLYDALNGRQVAEIAAEPSDCDWLPATRESKFSAFVTIMRGCENFCSYCIVPYVRGRERSRSMEDIIAEAKQLAAEGYVEITLLGQNVNSYQSGSGKPAFPQLLRELDKIVGLEFIRFMTSHPKDLSPDLIDAMRDCEKVCNHIHLPVQSGSSAILAAMNRGYTAEQYIDLITGIRREIPDIGITTDIIVGFPGETDDDFNQTVSLVEKVRFDAAYTFMYSPRKGTKAAEMGGQIPAQVKRERLQVLNAVIKRIAAEDGKKLAGRVFRVLFEGKTPDGNLRGRAENGRMVYISGEDGLIGRVIPVRIKGIRENSLIGEAEREVK